MQAGCSPGELSSAAFTAEEVLAKQHWIDGRGDFVEREALPCHKLPLLELDLLRNP